MPNTVVDPWLLNPDGSVDPFAANVKWDSPDLPDPDEPLSTEDPVLEPISELTPEIITTPVITEPVTPVEPVADDEPETMDLEDGTQLVLQKDKGWWVGSVVGQAGSPQVYKGATKNKLVMEILKAQANATRKIREQNAKIKFGSAPAKPVPQQTPAPVTRQLTAEEIFEYKTMWETDPVAANDFLMLKTRGVTLDQLISKAETGARAGTQASNQLTAESVNKTFLANNPDYYPDANFTNLSLMFKYLFKFKLGETFVSGDLDAACDKLVSSGNYTAENIEEAFADMSDPVTGDPHWVRAPRQPKQNLPKADTPPPVAVQHEPAPAPRPDPRIVHTETRPRAALGIQRSDVTPVKPKENPTAPSVEDFENMTDEQIKAQMAAVRRYRATQNRRSN